MTGAMENLKEVLETCTQDELKIIMQKLCTKDNVTLKASVEDCERFPMSIEQYEFVVASLIELP